MAHDLSKHFVYLYRDPIDNRIRYVGLATLQARAKYQRPEAHRRCQPEKCNVRRWLDDLAELGRTPNIEVINCDSEAQAKAIEAALISALWVPQDAPAEARLLNKIKGCGSRFRPLGLPLALEDRAHRSPVSRAALGGLGPALVVNISSKSFHEVDQASDKTFKTLERPGAVLASRTDEKLVLERYTGWWMIGTQLERWRDGDEEPPRLLVAVTGHTERKWIWAASRIDIPKLLTTEPEDGGYYRIPVLLRTSAVVDPLTGMPSVTIAPTLDARELRGRRVVPRDFGPRVTGRGRAFGSYTSQFFDYVPASGCKPVDEPAPTPLELQPA
ncbi:hypothetical protein GB931_16630 [Modestobacter sp. I12A-02628]|uniref:GIY-YIG domain-containing protein n=1 Tax=Goekera deserti TaxID=2497753 RepID=A0A7K3WCK6_9ACTN|nr:hypothetical protein [Goekera deserti]MPQ99511.1 hypothetical protein [Goekera deserti]NDI48998.1 hypothetical protein [Goekera deserti]NEL54211.1 hypothetical protein [Goekera deserti]